MALTNYLISTKQQLPVHNMQQSEQDHVIFRFSDFRNLINPVIEIKKKTKNKYPAYLKNNIHSKFRYDIKLQASEEKNKLPKKCKNYLSKIQIRRKKSLELANAGRELEMEFYYDMPLLPEENKSSQP